MPAVEVSIRVGVCMLACLLVGVGTPVVLRRLAEPSPDEPDAETKRSYASLADPRFVAAVVVATAVFSVATVWLLPVAWWPPWLVVATVGVLLAAVDTATTWLPNALIYPTWAAMALSAPVAVLLGAGWATVGWMAVVSAGWGALFWAVWLISGRRIGFGDVRLAFALGAAAGSLGWMAGYACVLLGTVVGAGWGVVHRLRHGPGAPPFAYGAALVAGCWLGLVVLGATGGLPG